MKFFLDAEGGALAFRKLQDYIDQDNGNYLGTLTDPLDPSDFSGSNTLDVKNAALAAIFIKPDVASDAYDYIVYGGINLTGDAASLHLDMSGWYALGSESAATAAKPVLVDCRYIDYLTIHFTSPPASGGKCSMFPIPYEESE